MALKPPPRNLRELDLATVSVPHSMEGIVPAAKCVVALAVLNFL
jgi:hypothetical protein